MTPSEVANGALWDCLIYTSTLLFLGTDPEDVIRNAFACFDEENTGKINEDRLRELLTTMGDRFTDAEVPPRGCLLCVSTECVELLG